MTVFEDLNPATGECLAEIPVTNPEELAAAVARARAAQPAWGARPAAERLELLRGIAARLEERAEELADLVTLEMGKPRKQALGEIASALRELAALGDERPGPDWETLIAECDAVFYAPAASLETPLEEDLVNRARSLAREFAGAMGRGRP